MASPGSDSVEKSEDKSEGADDVRLPKEQPPSPFFETKTFRLISIFLYLGGISSLGMVLALYYLLFFDSSMPDIHLKFPVSIGGHPVQKVHEYQ
ncbi:uncharacterized protein Dana_GF20254 [Drosophila ananassae]|uniref:Uncharacterized protein n=1 Tax=Drosophila ananassae TaxID=7217 RepID=B3MQF1_DROAN|nr:uncharacterized protein LOC6502965 [Drosophila ananassae]EDV44577.1 uncharacterized protein Dana_GF20254 [Drosophila ananassae]